MTVGSVMNTEAFNYPCFFTNVGYLAGQLSEVHLEPCQTSMMKFFCENVNSQKHLVFSQKTFTIDP